MKKQENEGTIRKRLRTYYRIYLFLFRESPVPRYLDLAGVVITLSLLPILSFTMNKATIGFFIIAITYSVAYPLRVFPRFVRYLKIVEEEGVDYFLPWFILISVGIVGPIFLFSVLYSSLAPMSSLGEELHWIYFSSITFAGLGLGDLPFSSSELAKIAVTVESLLGYLYFGIIIVYTAKLVGIMSGSRKQEGREKKSTVEVKKDLSSRKKTKKYPEQQK